MNGSTMIRDAMRLSEAENHSMVFGNAPDTRKHGNGVQIVSCNC
jgi:hypothetical protein